MRRGGGGGFLASDSIETANRTWQSNRSTLTGGRNRGFQFSGLGKSKDYYEKYIHKDNQLRMMNQSRQKDKYIPKSETEQKTYHQKFKHYMKQLDIEEKQEAREKVS